MEGEGGVCNKGEERGVVGGIEFDDWPDPSMNLPRPPNLGFVVSCREIAEFVGLIAHGIVDFPFQVPPCGVERHP